MFYRKTIKKLKETIKKYDENAKTKWEEHQRAINELKQSNQMLIDAVNQDRLVIQKIIKKISKKTIVTMKKKGK